MGSWKAKACEKEKELSEALNEVRCLHVADTKVGGSVAEWLGHRTWFYFLFWLLAGVVLVSPKFRS